MDAARLLRVALHGAATAEPQRGDTRPNIGGDTTAAVVSRLRAVLSPPPAAAGDADAVLAAAAPDEVAEIGPDDF